MKISFTTPDDLIHPSHYCVLSAAERAFQISRSVSNERGDPVNVKITSDTCVRQYEQVENIPGAKDVFFTGAVLDAQNVLPPYVNPITDCVKYFINGEYIANVCKYEEGQDKKEKYVFTKPVSTKEEYDTCASAYAGKTRTDPLEEDRALVDTDSLFFGAASSSKNRFDSVLFRADYLGNRAKWVTKTDGDAFNVDVTETDLLQLTERLEACRDPVFARMIADKNRIIPKVTRSDFEAEMIQ